LTIKSKENRHGNHKKNIRKPIRNLRKTLRNNRNTRVHGLTTDDRRPTTDRRSTIDRRPTDDRRPRTDDRGPTTDRQSTDDRPMTDDRGSTKLTRMRAHPHRKLIRPRNESNLIKTPALASFESILHVTHTSCECTQSLRLDMN